MAARLLIQRSSVATAAVGMALYPTTVLAEAPPDYKKKSIYDDVDLPPANAAPPAEPKAPAAPVGDGDSKPHRPTPTDRLAVQIGNARLFVHKYAAIAEDKVNETLDSAFHLEKSFTGTLASLAPPADSGEKLMPGSIYVLVAAMAGSIVTRNRNVILRASVPLAVGIGAGWAVLPITMRNVSDLAWEYEKKVPALADAHVQLREGIEKGVSFARVHKEVGVRYVDDKVTDARETVEGWVKQGK